MTQVLVEDFCFVSPAGDCGLGLFARSPLKPGQWIGEYTGHRLPPWLHKTGEYVLAIPSGKCQGILIDGAAENSPVPSAAACAAIRANHSARFANARLELWPQPNADPLDVQEGFADSPLNHR